MTKLQKIKRDIDALVSTIEKAEAEGIVHLVESGMNEEYKFHVGTWGSRHDRCGCLFGAATMVLDGCLNAWAPDTEAVERTSRKSFPTLCSKASWNDFICDKDGYSPVFNILANLSERLDRADIYAFLVATSTEEWLEWIKA